MKAGNLNIKAGIFSVAIAFALILLKLYGWVITDSLSIFSSLIDSSLDFATSIINLLAISYALKPADEDHPYGHESIEDIVGLLQAAFIFGSACFICYEGLQRFIYPVTVKDNQTGIIIMLISLAATIALVFYQRLIIRKTKSIVVESDSVHYLSDVLSGVLIIASLILSEYEQFRYIDPLLAILISVYISISAYKIGKRAFDNLMNKEIPEKDKNRIIEILNENKKHRGFHQFKTRASGNKIFIQFDIELDGRMSLQEAHDISAEIMYSIQKEYPNSEIIIHFDPEKDEFLS